MNGDPDTAFELMDTMLEDLDVIQGVDVVVCPPFTSIETFADMFDGTTLFLGAQNMHWEERGAFTGEISPLMLQNRCDYVILGHSERRRLFDESNENVHRKVEAALEHDLLPIICVGESLEQHDADETSDVVQLQVTAAMQNIQREAAGTCVIAYEPVWAIGTGRPATAEDANVVCRLIRGLVRSLHGDHAGEDIRILYGGSVNADNILEFMAQPEIDGALVGGASLDPDQFVRIVAKTAEAYRKVEALSSED